MSMKKSRLKQVQRIYDRHDMVDIINELKDHWDPENKWTTTEFLESMANTWGKTARHQFNQWDDDTFAQKIKEGHYRCLNAPSVSEESKKEVADIRKKLNNGAKFKDPIFLDRFEEYERRHTAEVLKYGKLRKS